MDDITRIVAPEAAETCFDALSHALTEAGMKLSEDKCTAWTTDGRPPDTPRVRALWSQAKDHRGLIVCGFPATFEAPETEAPLAFPIGNPDYIKDFLAARKHNLEFIFKRITFMATEASASTPSVQAFSCMLRSCISQKIGLLRILPPEMTATLTKATDEGL